MAESIHLLHLSDTHLGYRQYGLHEREKDFYEAFEEAMDIAIREHVDVVIHSGDFFDTTRPPVWALRYAINSLRKLHEHRIPVVAVLGDHDLPKRKELPPLYFLEELGLVRVVGRVEHPPRLHRIETRHGVLYVAGIANHKSIRRELLREKLVRLANPEKPSVLVLHQSLREVSPEYELSLNELPRGYAYYALGHIHVHRVFQLGGAVAAYSGSTEVVRVDELGVDKIVALVEIRGSETVALERVRLESVRPQLRVQAGIDELAGRLEEVLARAKWSKKPLIHVEVHGPPSKKRHVYTILERVLGEKALSYRLLFHPTETGEPSADQHPVLEHSVDLQQLLYERLRDRELAELALRLIHVLGYGSPTLGVEEAKKATIEWFEKRYGVKP